MSQVRCPYCGGTQGRCTTSAAARPITECVCCGRVVEERRPQPHDLFFLRAQDSPLCLVTPDLLFPTTPLPHPDDDPFETTGFITAFSTWSLELCPLFAHSASSFSGYLAELERVLLDSADGSSPNAGLIDNLRAYLQIIDVSSILGLDRDISDHAIQLFRDCSCTTYLRNRNVEALATAALVQAIREAQEPRTLQEISAAANVPQKEIGKYIKILGDALQLSQPINSNSISVHMPRFCSLLQLNKSTQDLATHIGEVVINKCFCTRRNPISISAAAIYLSCQLEDKRKTQAEICKVTGLTEVTLRKVYKELLENWDNLLPPNYTPAVPPERAFPMTMITSGRSSLTSRIDAVDISPPGSQSESQKQSEVICKSPNLVDVVEGDQTSLRNPLSMPFGVNIDSRVVLSEMSQTGLRKHSFVFGMPAFRPEEEKNQKNDQCNSSRAVESEQKAERDPRTNSAPQRVVQGSSSSMATNGSSTGESASAWPFRAPLVSGGAYGRFVLPAMVANFEGSTEGIGNQIISDKGGGSLNASKKFHGGGGGGLATCNSSNHMKQMPFHLSANTELGGGACDFSDGHEGGC